MDEPTISLNETLAQATVESLFIDIGEDGVEPTFSIDGSGAVRILGNSPIRMLRVRQCRPDLGSAAERDARDQAQPS